MPIIKNLDYQPPAFLFNGHLQTIIPSQFRIVRDLAYERIKIRTQDEDFLLLDWSKQGNSKLAIISHGLEGDSLRPYMRGMARAFNRAGYDALAWNFRGCGGEINKVAGFYHSGATHDLKTVVDHVRQHHDYQEIVMVGFSLGGNLMLKYLGENGKQLPGEIKAGIAISVPLDLNACATQIALASNFIYSWRFVRNLKKKIRAKVQIMPTDRIHDGCRPDVLSTEHLGKIKSIKQFDEYYTAPLHGFIDATDYYEKCSSLHFLKDIEVPTLMLNAKNDPFLADNCYFDESSLPGQNIYFAAPEEGGHCGFMQKNVQKHDNFWSEEMAIQFADVSLGLQIY